MQGELEEAVRVVLWLPEPVTVTCAGRTDTGVHARGQVTHVDVEGAVDPLRLLRGLNGVLPADVAVTAVTAAPEGFDARFSALARRYVYRLCDDPAGWDPLTRGHVLRVGRPMDVDRMNAAATGLLGEHDFAAFCKKREGATTVRTLLDLSWGRDAAGLAVATVRADAFCHHMVRALVGAMVAVGEGRREPGWAGDVLVAGVRDAGVTVMPAHGLTLEEVGYPDDEGVAAQAEAARRVRDAASLGSSGQALRGASALDSSGRATSVTTRDGSTTGEARHG